MRRIRALVGKELRQHALLFLGLAGVLGLTYALVIAGTLVRPMFRFSRSRLRPDDAAISRQRSDR